MRFRLLEIIVLIINFKYYIIRSFECRSYVSVGLLSVGLLSVGLLSV